VASAHDRNTVEVRVELKPGIADAEADNIEKSLRLLGLSGLKGVRTARIFALTFEGLSEEEARERAARAVDQLLANPVIHRVSYRTPGSD
jgi:phosphoribosylformylglycinamidine synthase PurS subunit